MEFNNKHVLVLGAGVSGISVSCILKKCGADVTLSDSKLRDKFKDNHFNEIEAQDIKLVLGNQDESLLIDKDYVVVSPGISINIPLIKAAKNKNITVISEIEVAYRICKAPIVAITGTNGKTTTTTLIGNMLENAQREVVVGGNIGQALSKEVEGITEKGIVVAEISSFQLEGIIKFAPHIAAILNVTPDHIDRHGSMENYIATKERIFANQSNNDYLVLNYDDEIVKDMGSRTSSQVFYFSRKTELAEGIYVKDGIIKIKWNNKDINVCHVKEINLPGEHNIENVLAACAVGFLAGISVDDMVYTIKEFKAVEHRIELVGNINNVAYYNDSKATNPESAIKALEAFENNIILIAGGRDKNTDLGPFMKLIKEKVACLILLGEASERFGAAAKDHAISKIVFVNSLEEAVKVAHDIAKSQQVVLLSPACSSYDMFKSYEERGKIFKQLVHKLK